MAVPKSSTKRPMNPNQVTLRNVRAAHKSLAQQSARMDAMEKVLRALEEIVATETTARRKLEARVDTLEGAAVVV